MPRYELPGGFFWIIELTDTQIATTVGKLGNAGHTRLKRYGSIAEAKREYDTGIAEKVTQGYALIGEKPAKKKPAAKKRPKKS